MSVEDLVVAVAGAAERLGVFEHAGTRDDIASALSLAPRRLGWMLDLLAATSWLVREGETYRAARRGDAFASGAKLVEKVIRRDRPLDVLELAGNIEAARLTCHAELAQLPSLAPRIAELVGDGVLLDAGCGDGSLANAVLAAAPRARVRLVDTDVRHAQRLAGPRVEIEAADLRAITQPARVVLLSNVLHMHPTETARALVTHATALVEPGGTLVIREIALDADRRGPTFGLAFATSLALHGDAELPTDAELRSWTPVTRAERIADSIVIESGAN